MSKEILDNKILSDIETGNKIEQESNGAEISEYTHEILEDIDKNLQTAKESGEVIKKDFFNIPEITKTVNQTAADTEEIADNSRRSILARLRESRLGHKVVKGATAAAFLFGINSLTHAENNEKQNESNKNKIEVNQQKLIENPSPESYDATKLIKEFNEKKESTNITPEACRQLMSGDVKSSTIELLSINIKIASTKIDTLSQDISRLEKESGEVNSQDSSALKQINDTLSEKLEKKNLFEKYLQEKKDLQEKINKEGVELSPEQEKIVENSSEIIRSFESAKKDILELISSDDYLQKLKKEFNCSLEEAKEHQNTRINNVNSVKYEFKSKEYLMASYFCQAYYDYDSHHIALPYNVDQGKLLRLAKHELLHCATMGSKGISAEAQKLLSKESLQENKKYYGDDSEKEYFSDPTERYARLKILDMELERLGIKEVGKKLSEKQYDKMMGIFMKSMFTQDGDEKNINRNAFDFIYFTKDGETKKENYELYKKLFDKVALNQENKTDSQEKGGTYQHAGWEYNDKNNLT